MPEDERPPPAADLSGPGWLELLAEGELEILGRLPWSSNYSFLAAVRLEAIRDERAVYKPGRGERPLWDYPGGLFRREVAAYELSAALGLDIVPETVLRLDGPHGEGSVQRFVDADFAEHYFTLVERAPPPCPAAPDSGVRPAGQQRRPQGRPSPHRLGRPDLGHRPRPVLPCGGQAPNGDVGLRRRGAAGRGAARAARPWPRRYPRSVAALLEDDECQALRRRAVSLLRKRRFPAPRDDYRAYPWPLV